MNVNGARFHQFLGRADWARCTDSDAVGATPLKDWWAVGGSPPLMAPLHLPAWDEPRAELTLQPLPIELPATKGEARLTLGTRRGASADRNGNVYRVADDAASLRVMSAGSGEDTQFWPALPDDCTPVRTRERLVFEPLTPQTAATSEHDFTLAVTADDYLVVAFERAGQRGLLSFDLFAGGQPVETLWPVRDFKPFDMCARKGGGVWILDHDHNRLWELDRTLSVIGQGQSSTELVPEELADFQPLSGPTRSLPAATFPEGLDLAGLSPALTDPIAIELLEDGAVLLLDRDVTQTHARVIRLQRSGTAWSVDASDWVPLPAAAHDCAFGAAPRYRTDDQTKRLFITTAVGNQAYAFELTAEAGRCELHASRDLFPLRLYAGRALVNVQDRVCYDSGFDRLQWIPIVQQPRTRFAQFAELVTPVLDSGELGTTWDKVLFDARIPADTTIEIESRAGDDGTTAVGSPPEVTEVIGRWVPEPSPRLRDTGPELPWLRREAARVTRRESGVGTWELLLQHARGRLLQLRVRLRSRSGTDTPRVRALRVWSPRFSYTQRFLPAVYREDAPSGALLERWLANFESTFTEIEGKVVSVQELFDARTTPTEALGWLAAWFELALDPGWDEARRRVFVQRAMDFFRWRGTIHGLRLLLELAFDPCFDPVMFDGPRPSDDGPRRIRIVEAYQRRLIGALAAGDPGGPGADVPRVVPTQARWSPAEGNAGLAERFAKQAGKPVTPVLQITPFPLVPPSDPDEQVKWRAFFESDVGFVPSAGASERRRWQSWLMSQYASVGDLNQAYGAAYAKFADVPLPTDAPANDAAAADWKAFCGRDGDTGPRARWQDFLARRYRRVERLQRAHGTSWSEFDLVPVPDVLPGTAAAQTDWLQFEGRLLMMLGTAHQFSVLLPLSGVTDDPVVLDARLGLARRLVDLEKPAHTTFDVRFFWAFNRIGEARLELDTQLGTGSRACVLIPKAVIGRAYIGASFVGGQKRPRSGDRMLIDS